METFLSYVEAREILLSRVNQISTEAIPLEESGGRILAMDLVAAKPVPPFDRSPYDGYAFRAEDTLSASADTPVTLEILEEVPAGATPAHKLAPFTAIKILTGAPIPEGADAVVPFEKTTFTDKEVTLYGTFSSGANIVRAGEDVKAGAVLARAGARIDPGLAGTLAAQGITKPLVYRKPLVGLISTGNEVVEPDTPLKPGQIYNSNRYSLSAALRRIGCEVEYLGLAGDNPKDISRLIDLGLRMCDSILLTGGVSVGDYDFTPAAMEQSGVDILFRGVEIKPGMACAYGIRNGKAVCGLSGNPASSITNFYAVALPSFKKLCGYREVFPVEFPLTLSTGFSKKSPCTRFLRGRLDLSEGSPRLCLPKDQGNVILSSSIGCDAFAIVPAGSGPVDTATILKGFMV